MSAGKISDYTNLIFTNVTADGKNYMPCKVYTHNPAFDPDGRKYKYVEECCKKLGVATSRIVYIKSTGKYVTESPDIVADFYNTYTINSRDVLFTDAGNAFSEKENQFLSTALLSGT